MTNKIYVKRSRRKSVAIKIDNQGIITVFCPLTYPEIKIQQLISEKRNWILTHLKRINNDNCKNVDFIDYKKLLFGGIAYDITYDDNTIKIGDIAQLSFDGDNFEHTLVIVNVENEFTLSKIKIASHTFDSLNKAISEYLFQKIRFIHISGVRTY